MLFKAVLFSGHRLTSSGSGGGCPSKTKYLGLAAWLSSLRSFPRNIFFPAKLMPRWVIHTYLLEMTLIAPVHVDRAHPCIPSLAVNYTISKVIHFVFNQVTRGIPIPNHASSFLLTTDDDFFLSFSYTMFKMIPLLKYIVCFPCRRPFFHSPIRLSPFE